MLLLVLGGLSLPAAAQDPVGLRIQEAASQLAKGNAGTAVAQYSDLLRDQSLPSDRRAMIHNDRGVAQSRLGQTKLALEDFNRAVQLFPEHAPTYNNRGSLLLSVGLPREALKDFDRAIVLAPGYSAAFANRASTSVKLGQAQEALGDYTRAIELVPTSAAALSGRGRALLLVERPHAAIRDFTRAVNADSRFAASYRSRAEARMALEKTEEAIEDLTRAIAFDSSNAEIYVLRGYAYLFARNYPSAVKDFTRAIELDGVTAAAYEARGLAFAMLDTPTEAFADISKALEFDQRSAVAFAYRAWIYQRGGQLDIGGKDLQTALKLDANRAEVAWVKGEYELLQGKPEAAIADYRRALGVKPTFKLASDALDRLGARANDAREVELPGLGVDRWRVVKRGARYFAVNDEFRRLSVPLEMEGKGEPRLVDWEVRKPPLKGIAALRFHSGVVAGAKGPEDTEQVAIIDLFSHAVVAIQPHRLGNKYSTWSWEEGKVVVASVDGVTDEYMLRHILAKDPALLAQARRVSSSGQTPSWAPWQPWESNNWASSGPPPPGPRGPRPSQQKSLFQMLFGN